MRGKENAIVTKRLNERITPAYAGKRIRRKILSFLLQDHPRLCGEKAFGNFLLHRCIGSPPPMRGKADVVLNRIDRIGITPAYAGKSCQIVAVFVVRRDHPRLCGEKEPYQRTAEKCKGSPPPMRGKAYPHMAKNVVDRITPAYAGKSLTKISML